MIPYDKFARFYDTMYPDAFSAHMVDYTLRILKKAHFQPETILDVCCGTGTAMQKFREKGFRIDGLDRSRGMLAAARRKLRGTGTSLYRRSLPRFEIVQSKRGGRTRLKHYDLVTSYFDSLNYLLTERDLQAAFRAIHRHLRPGGWFVFDMNTVAMFKTLWNENAWSGVRDNMIWIMRSEFLRAKSMTRLSGTFLEKQGGGWRRYDEVHHERAYPNATIRSMLRRAGFQIKGYYHCLTFDPATRDSKKFCAAVRKPD